MPVPKARPGSSRTHDGFGIAGGRLVVRHDPQPPAEAHGVEILQPLAFPDAIGDALDADALRGQVQCSGQHDDGFGRGRLGGEQRLQHRLRPQPHLAGRRLEDGVVDRVGERHGQRAGVEQRRFGGFDARST